MTDHGANYDSEKSTVSLRQYVESLIRESDKRNEAQFTAAKEAVAAALAAAKEAVAAALVAQDKLTSAAFVAAKEALAEAQIQLTAYKAQSNEWRATLTDLINTLMLRPEILAMFSGVNKNAEELGKRVSALENSGQFGRGQAEASIADRTKSQWNFATILSVITLLLLLASLFLGKKP
jgi:hypothetical protein